LLKRYLVLPCLLIVSALAFAACGSSDNEESQIEDVVTTSATNTDPANCKKLSTQQFLEQTTQTQGSEALEECEKEATEESGAKSATVSEIEVDGSDATANAALSGGGFDGQEVEVALVKEDDQWKLDEIAGFVKFDQAKLIETLEREFAKPSAEISKSLASCITNAFAEAPPAKFEDALLDVSTEGFEELAGDCF